MKQIISYLMIAFIFMGCNATYQNYNPPERYYKSSQNLHYENLSTYYGGEYANVTGGVVSTSIGSPKEKVIDIVNPKNRQIIIYNANLVLETDELPDSINSKLMSIAEKYGGYSTNRSYSYIVIRVKSENLKEALVDISNLGKVIEKSVTGTDLSKEFSDLNIEMDNFEKSRQRYLELLAKAENVETALLVEKELGRILYEINKIKGRLESISHLNNFSTITINHIKPTKLGPISIILNVVYSGVKWLFVWD